MGFGLLEGHTLCLQTELAVSEPGALQQRIGELDCPLLVLGASAADAPLHIRQLVEHLTCDVLVIGWGQAAPASNRAARHRIMGRP